MILLEEAQVRLLALAEPLETVKIPVNEAAGRYLGTSLIAQRTQPAADLSAMDGYATAGPMPWRVIGESRCGEPFAGKISTGKAVRISTGALIPDGADRIALQEEVDRMGDEVIHRGDLPQAGKHIRRAGFDFAKGDLLLKAGTRIGPAHIALIRAAGHGEIAVHREPAVTLMDIGDELTADPEHCLVQTIPASNGAMLSAMAAHISRNVHAVGPLPDRIEEIVHAFEHASSCDLIVTSSGASVGDHDLIRPALEAWGAEIEFWRVAIKPGKPLMVARRGKQIILGLPGNPVSSFVTGFLFMLPLLRHLAGANAPFPLRRTSRSGVDLPPTGPRRTFVRAIDDGTTVTPVSEQDSSSLRSLVGSNALIERREHAPEVKAGSDVPIYLL